MHGAKLSSVMTLIQKLKYLWVLLPGLCLASPAWAGERILALAPHACEILYAIGAGEDVVGAVSYCDYPQAVLALPRVGSYERINVEAALALEPTMAIVMDESIPGASKLRDLGVKVVASYPRRVDEVLTEICRIGAETGHQKQADALAEALQQRLDKLKAPPGGPQQASVFYEIWAEPLLTAGKSSFIDDVLHRMGLRNVFGDVALEAPRVNVEAVIAARPDVVVIPSENRDVAERQAFWQKWLGQDVRVIAVNPDLMHRPGPRLLDGMEDLYQQLSQGQTFEH